MRVTRLANPYGFRVSTMWPLLSLYEYAMVAVASSAILTRELHSGQLSGHASAAPPSSTKPVDGTVLKIAYDLALWRGMRDERLSAE